MQRLKYSHVVISCQKTLEFGEPDEKGNFHTTCPSDYECYGCSGRFFVPPPDPRTLVKVMKWSARPWKEKRGKLTDIPGVILSGYPQDYFFFKGDIEEINSEYPGDEYYYVLSNNGCELTIYKIGVDH